MSLKSYKGLGLMSGSSLDGLDIAYCQFDFDDQRKAPVHWKILQAATLPFSETWQNRLIHLPMQSAQVFAKTDVYLGYYFGELCNAFIKNFNIQPEFIASHGHTIFHDPNRRFTAQIGDGAAIAGTTNITTICNFRNQDIALGGEGAPIAPIADQLLLQGFDFYLNLGGIANISCSNQENMYAFDITGANQVLNHLAHQKELDYDDNGRLAASGQLIDDLFNQSNAFSFFEQPYPKSLSNQWVQEHLTQLFLSHEGSIEDKLHTMVHHIAFQIKQSINQAVFKEQLSAVRYKMIVTGGGAFNDFLIKTINSYCPELDIHVPDDEVIAFKEAAMIAFMGALRLENRVNTIPSVTGAKEAVIAGAVYQVRESKGK